MASKDGRVWKDAPPELRAKAIRMFDEEQRKEQDRVSRFGQVRPQQSNIVWKGDRIVAVRNRIYRSARWKFFPDFLRDYVPGVLGANWWGAEAAKPEADRHPIVNWRALGAAYMNAQPPQPDGSRAAVPSGALAAYNCFAYDLYIVDDNGGLDAELLHRLKIRDQFQGARHELFAEATCYRAGFTVQHEDEKDGTTKHAEFTVRHGATGQLLSVEAKSKHREGVLGYAGTRADKPDFRLGPLINDAVAKHPRYPLVIFIDTNVPSKWAERVLGRQPGDILSRPLQRVLDTIKKHHNDLDPYCMIVFSNHPHHYEIHGPVPEKNLLSVVPQPPNAHPLALRSLHLAAGLFGNVPMSFTTDEGDPPPPAVQVTWPKVRYDLEVNGSDVSVFRERQLISQTFLTTEKDRFEAPSRLHEFLEDVGLSRVDAHMICTVIEEGHSVSGVFAPK